ncbi:TPA: hypothetical protein ACF8KN_004478 [Salmonella enterica]
MNSPYNIALENINEIAERNKLGQELRAKGKDGISTWSTKDSRDASLWLNGYVKALEDNSLITDEQSQFLSKQILSITKKINIVE